MRGVAPSSERDLGGHLRLIVDPALSESVVEAALHQGADLLHRRLQFEFRRRADGLYRETSGRQRERAFQELYADLFGRLGALHAVETALHDFPSLPTGLHTLVLQHARRPDEEGSDLGSRTGGANERRQAIVRLRPARFVDAAGLQAFLRFAFTQLSDLTDPAFGYDGSGLPADIAPMEARVFLQLYGCVWAAYTEARMHQRGWDLPSDRQDLAVALHSLAGDPSHGLAEDITSRVARGDTLTHSDLLQFVRELRAASRRAGGAAAGVCALCGFASARLFARELLSTHARAVLARDYPRVGGGVCGHCAERLTLLYSTAPTRVHAGGDPCPI